LAIELAASRTALFAPEELLERLSERLDLLDAGPRADPRHRTLRATTDWSVEMLDEEQVRLFRRLSVFAADAPWEAIERVCQATPDTFAPLVERRLVRRRAGRDGRPRLGMLETIRQYAAELLAADPTELAACRRRHAEAILDRARELTEDRGSMHELEAMRPELMAALATAREAADPRVELELVVAIHGLWRLRGPYVEGIDALERALARASSAAACTPARLALADLAVLHGDAATGAAVAQEALAEALAADDRRMQARALNIVGNAAFAIGNPRAAVDAYRRAIEIEKPRGTSGYLLAPLSNLGHTLLELGDLEGARTTLDECLVACAETDDRRRASACLHSLGLLALHEGRLTDADDALRAGLEIAIELGIAKYAIDILGVLGAMRVAEGDVAVGVRLLAAADVHGAALGLVPDPADSVAVRVRDDALRSALE
jgi:tetratricopeptide (TPR) repeat protein